MASNSLPVSFFIPLLLVQLLFSGETVREESPKVQFAGYVLQYSPEYQYKDIKIAFRELFSLYASRFGIKMDVVFYDDEKKAVEDFCRGKISSISGPGIVFANNYKKLFPKSSIFYLASKSSNIYVTHLLLKRREVTAPLYEATVSIPQSRYNARLYLYRYLSELDKEFPVSSMRVVETKNSRIAIFHLFFGKTDFAVVPKESWEIAIEMNPQLKSKIEIVEHSPNIMIYAAGCYSKMLDPEMVETVLEANRKIAASAVGRKMLELLHIDKYIEVSSKELTPYIKYVEETKRFMAKKRSVKEE